jgi:hypothetical protein
MIGEWKGSRKLFGNDEPVQNGTGHALAAPSGKGKRIHQDGADLLAKFLAHEPPRATQLFSPSPAEDRGALRVALSHWLSIVGFRADLAPR